MIQQRLTFSAILIDWFIDLRSHYVYQLIKDVYMVLNLLIHVTAAGSILPTNTKMQHIQKNNIRYQEYPIEYRYI